MPTNVDAPHSGTVEELLVEAGSPVEYGQPLLILRRAAHASDLDAAAAVLALPAHDPRLLGRRAGRAHRRRSWRPIQYSGTCGCVANRQGQRSAAGHHYFSLKESARHSCGASCSAAAPSIRPSRPPTAWRSSPTAPPAVCPPGQLRAGRRSAVSRRGSAWRRCRASACIASWKPRGSFEPSRKRPLPGLPRRIGIVSSERGAVIHDLLSVLERRYPARRGDLRAGARAGPGAAAALAQAIRRLGRWRAPRRRLDVWSSRGAAARTRTSRPSTTSASARAHLRQSGAGRLGGRSRDQPDALAIWSPTCGRRRRRPRPSCSCRELAAVRRSAKRATRLRGVREPTRLSAGSFRRGTRCGARGVARLRDARAARSRGRSGLPACDARARLRHRRTAATGTWSQDATAVRRASACVFGCTRPTEKYG